MSRSLVPIDLIASDCCGDIGDSVFKRKFIFTRKIAFGYSRLHLFLLAEKSVQSVVLPYDNIVNLPCDFSRISKVGVRREPGGCIAILSVASDPDRQILSDSATCEYLNSVWSGEYGPGGYPFYNAWGGAGYYGELYGVGRGIVNSGTYYVDQANGTLAIGSNIPPGSEIIVEYVSNGLTNGLKVVPMEMKECLTYWAKYQYYADRNSQLSELNFDHFKREYNILKRFYRNKTPYEIATAVNASISPTNY